MQREYDYTSKRLGSRQPPYNKKVIVCQKCGRRGTDDGILVNKKQPEFSSQSVTHSGRLGSIAGLAIFHTIEWCSYHVNAPVEASV